MEWNQSRLFALIFLANLTFFSRLFKLQRLIICSEKALIPFTTNNFKFSNTKFLELEKEIPLNEIGDFYLRKENNPSFIQFVDDSFKVMLQVMFNQDFKDIGSARKRYKKILFISRTYQISMYFIIFYLVCKALGCC